jgi:hypothetical protein
VAGAQALGRIRACAQRVSKAAAATGAVRGEQQRPVRARCRAEVLAPATGVGVPEAIRALEGGGPRPGCGRSARGYARTMPRRRTALLTPRRREPGRRPVIAGVAAAVALALGGRALLARRRRAGGDARAEQPAPVVPGPPSEDPVTGAVEERWACACGQEYRVQGEDRHRVYWLADASVSDPVLDPDCPKCGRPLPSEHEQRTSAPPS